MKNCFELFELKETHFISFITGDDRYSREAVTGDLENLQSFYMDQGYVNFAVTLPVVSFHLIVIKSISPSILMKAKYSESMMFLWREIWSTQRYS